MAEGAPLLREYGRKLIEGSNPSLSMLLDDVMPELPEVQTVVSGLQETIVGLSIKKLNIYQPQLRTLIDLHLESYLSGYTITSITRRAKYICINFEHGSLIIHLGMSGRLLLQASSSLLKKHDHGHQST